MLDDDALVTRRCRALVADLPLPFPFTEAALVAAVASRVGRTIELRTIPESVNPEVTGFTTPCDWGYVLSYRQDQNPWCTLTYIAHELAHIMCGHLIGDTAVVESPDEAAEPILPAVASRLRTLPVEDLAREWKTLYRCDLSGPDEHEAELIATLLVQRVETMRGQGPSSEVAEGTMLARYVKALSGTRSRRAQH